MFESIEQANNSGFNVCPKGAQDTRGCYKAKFYHSVEVDDDARMLKGNERKADRQAAWVKATSYWTDIYQTEVCPLVCIFVFFVFPM